MNDTEAGGETGAAIGRAWWKEAVVYQIYPRSFNDSNEDGVGDLRGITRTVEYLDALGVDIVWLCPVYDSPNADNGYDIRDYRKIDERFGTMADWKELLDALHAQDIRLIMDLVVNHTSDEHEWFERSRREEGRFEEYYYWRDGSPETPPNNWESIFGGSAWTYDERREEWYLHTFDAKQPDLDWRNPAVRADVTDMITWWLEKGIDGFRIDAIPYLSKEEGLPDGDPTNSPVGTEQFSHGPHLDDYFAEIHEKALSGDDVVTVGEMGDTTIEQAAEYVTKEENGLDMVFQFDHVGIDAGPNGMWDTAEMGEWDLRDLKTIVTRKQAALEDGGWDALFLGNHDMARSVSRFGDEAYRTESATLLATFLLTMRGTPYIYQGEEIGMTNAEFGGIEALDDPMTIGIVEELLADGGIDSDEQVRALVNYRSRDHSRTPMQWNSTTNAGFSENDPWLPVNENYTAINVVAARADERSIWHGYRRLIALRHAEDVLVYGEYDLLCPDHERIYAYTRTLGDDQALVVLNWSAKRAAFADVADDLDTTDIDAADIEADGGIGGGTGDAELLYGNYDDSPTAPASHELRPYEALVYRL